MGEKVSPVKRLTEAMGRVMSSQQSSAKLEPKTFKPPKKNALGLMSQIAYDTVPVTTTDGIPHVAYHNAHHRNTQAHDRKIARRTRSRRRRRR